MTETLREQLAALARDRARAAGELEERIKTADTRRDGIRAELEALSDRLAALDREIDQLLASRRSEAWSHATRECQLVCGGLARSYAAILDAHDFWREMTALNGRRRTLLRGDPGLEQALQDYQSFEKSRATLDALPALHRQALLDTQAVLQRRVAPYLELHDAALQVQGDRRIALQIVVVGSADQAAQRWVLALPEGLENLPADIDGILSELAAGVTGGLADCGTQPGWSMGQVAIGGWAGFAEVVISGAQRGEGDLVALTEQLVRTRLLHLPLNLGGVIDLQVAEMSELAWKTGQELPKAAIAGGDARPPDTALDSAPGSWYSPADVLSWSQSSAAWPAASQSAQARRLRTLLTRLAARGSVGSTPAPLDELWKPLPAPDNQEMRAGIERLIAKGVLVEHAASPEQGRRVALNPHRLDEARDLINGDVTEFWADVLDERPQTPTPASPPL
jgi:hypothetical protein